jgi:hypothetical protein
VGARQYSYLLEPSSEGTLVRMEGEVAHGRASTIVVYLVWPVYRWSVRAGHRKLARAIEAARIRDPASGDIPGP